MPNVPLPSFTNISLHRLKSPASSPLCRSPSVVSLPPKLLSPPSLSAAEEDSNLVGLAILASCGVNAQKETTTEREREMQQRNSGNRRPSGTDGSDFSYRMVVDNRYTKVAKGKSSLSKVLVIQAVVVFIGVLDIPFKLLKKEPLETLYAASSSLTLISIIIGELGRKRSRVKLLKLYMVASSIGLLGSIASIIQNNTQLKVISEKFAVLKIACVFAGLLIQIFSIYKTTSLIGNMSPPKRAS